VNISGVAEARAENCEEKVKSIIAETLELSVDDIRFVRVHRLGKYQEGKTRPIIARFHYFGDRLNVWRERGKLRNSDYWMAEDFPFEIQNRRRMLKLILSRANELNGNDYGYLVSDKLVLDGKTYTVNNLQTLPEELQLKNVCTPAVSDNLVAFYNEHSPLSNFHRAPFVLENTQYFHVEQY